MVTGKPFLGKYKPNTSNLKLYGICKKLCFFGEKSDRFAKKDR